MHTNRITVADRRRHADRTTVRWRVMLGTGVIGLLAALVVRIWGDPQSRADETLVLVVTVLVVGLSPLVEWVFRFAFARVSTLSERLEAANREIERLSDEAARLHGALHFEDFSAEGEEFGSLAARFWLTLEMAFDRQVTALPLTRKRTLQEVADAASWPDRAAPESDASTSPDRVLAGFASCVYPQYGFELIPRERFGEFAVQHANVRRRIRQWGEALKGGQGSEVSGWLGRRIAPAHSSTIKLAWYLELANIVRTGEQRPTDIAYYRTVRDALESVEDQAAAEAPAPKRGRPDSTTSPPSLRSSKVRRGGLEPPTY
jgi:hypothetical protein